MLEVGIIFGGRSGEHDVSLMSARSVLENIDNEKYNVHKIGITKRGSWKLFKGELSLMTDGDWESQSDDIVFPPDPKYGGYLNITTGEAVKLDVVFPVMHGPFAEDGTVQSVFELARVKYVGSKVLGSAVAMDKVVAKQIFSYSGIDQCAFEEVRLYEYERDPRGVCQRLSSHLGYPMFVKPANMGSSVGISKVNAEDELVKALVEAFKYDDKLVVEENVDCREIECAVIGDGDNVYASTPGEIIPAKEFYDYEAKYDDNFDSLINIPAQLPCDVIETIRVLAVKAYRALNCAGLSRVDFFYKKDGSGILINEINTLPGFTKISMYPKMMIADGMTYKGLISRLIEDAYNSKMR
ncbi:MAG: D-alanine--D-alanine ligase [Clostridiales bacterium]|nr:D-alanine--D-alanine ligase [Clostridiales bacterium]